MDFRKKTILITGASYGIGKAIANYFAKLGSNIIITYNQSQDLSNNVVFEIKQKYGVLIDNFKCDLSCEDDVNNLCQFVKQKYGHLDILINNSALSLDSHLSEKTKDEFMKVLEVNVVGTFLMMKYFSQITSYIFNISSTDAFDTGNIFNVDYSCSKAGINSLTKSFATFEKKSKYIAICPNWVKTEPVMAMDQDFLQSELERVGQDKLINPVSIPIMIKRCINDNIESGSIIRIDGDINE